MDTETGTRKKEIVVPGTVLNRDQPDLKAGFGTFREKDDVMAMIIGLKDVRSNYINVIPLSGRYIPQFKKNDLVIGVVEDTNPSSWMVDINSPYPGLLHVNDAPWRVNFGETQKYLDVGDVVLAKVESVNTIKKVMITMKERGLKKLDSGHVIEVVPTKVPRIIGKKGSMIALIKRFTDVRIFVGQNGRIWLQGELDRVELAERAIRMIERYAHMPGLTDEMERFLEAQGDHVPDFTDSEKRQYRGDPDRGPGDERAGSMGGSGTGPREEDIDSELEEGPIDGRSGQARSDEPGRKRQDGARTDAANRPATPGEEELNDDEIKELIDDIVSEYDE